jgi:hypothetical protein
MSNRNNGIALVTGAFSGIGLVVNNAGIGLLGAVEQSSIAQPNPLHPQHGAYHHG